MLTHQFKTGVLLPNRPLQPSQEDRKNRTFNIILNSADKMTGTNAKAVYKVNLGTNPFKNPKITIRMLNFNPTYPTNTSGGIVFVNLNEMTDPLTYKSDTKNRHGVLGVVQLIENTPVTYPLGLAVSNNTWTVTPYTGGVQSQYVASASTVQSSAAYQAFNGSNGTSWSSASGVYSTSTNAYTGAVTTATVGLNNDPLTIGGEWLQLKLATPIKLSSYMFKLGSSSFKPRAWYICCSNDGTNWVWFENKPNLTTVATDNTWVTFTCATPPNGYYQYYRLIVTHSYSFVNINELRYNGNIQEQQISTTTGLPNKRPINNTHELVSVDKNMFDKLITIELTSPTVDVTNMNAYTMQLAVYDENEDEFTPS